MYTREHASYFATSLDYLDKIRPGRHILLTSPLQLLEILNLESEFPPLVPIQTPVYLPDIHPQRPHAFQPIQDIPLLLPRIRLWRLLPADLQGLDVRVGQPLPQLPDALLDLRDARVGLDLAGLAVALLGAQVDGYVQVPDGGRQVAREHQVGPPRLVHPHVVVDRDIHRLRRGAVHQRQRLGTDLVVHLQQARREGLREGDVGLQLPRVRAADGRARGRWEEVPVDHLADLARQAEEGRQVFEG